MQMDRDDMTQNNRDLVQRAEEVKRRFNLDRPDIAALYDSGIVSGWVGDKRYAVKLIDDLLTALQPQPVNTDLVAELRAWMAKPAISQAEILKLPDLFGRVIVALQPDACSIESACSLQGRDKQPQPVNQQLLEALQIVNRTIKNGDLILVGSSYHKLIEQAIAAAESSKPEEKQS